MLNKAMLLPAGGPHLAKIAVRALIQVYTRTPELPKEDEWEALDGSASSPEAEFLRVKECPGAHLVLKRIVKGGNNRSLGFVFLIEPDVTGDVEAVSKLQKFLASKRLHPVLFDKNLEVKPSLDTYIGFLGTGEVSFTFSKLRGGLYQGVEERPAGSREYYLQLECYVGLTR